MPRVTFDLPNGTALCTLAVLVCMTQPDAEGNCEVQCVVRSLKPERLPKGTRIITDEVALRIAFDTVSKGLALMVPDGTTVH